MSLPVYAQGVDVASYQGTVDWHKVRNSGKMFAYVKASEGTSHIYPTFAPQISGARANGLWVGGYHYARPEFSPVANADAFCSQILAQNADIPGCLPPCLDLESGTGNLVAWGQAFIARCRANLGINQMMIYSGLNFWNAHLSNFPIDSDLGVWIAQYNGAGNTTFHSPGLKIQQYSDAGNVPGIAGAVDLNAALVPIDHLLIPAPIPPDPITDAMGEPPVIYVKIGDGTIPGTRYAMLYPTGVMIELHDAGEKNSAEDVIQRQHQGASQFVVQATWDTMTAISQHITGP